MLKKSNILLFLLLVLLGACSDDNEELSVDWSQIKKVDDFVDPRDGHVYQCVQIGDQIWMAENLAYYLPEGACGGCFTWNEEPLEMSSVSIPNERWVEIARELLNDPSHDWEAEGVNLDDLDFCISLVEMGLSQSVQLSNIKDENPVFYLPFVEKLDEAKLDYLPVVAAEHAAAAEAENGNYSETYGYLYTLDAAKKSVPDGWRLPSDADWQKLEKALGMSSSDQEKMNAWRGSTQGDMLKNGGAALFNAKMAGCNAYVPATNAMEYINLRNCAYYWASDEKEVEDLSSDGGLVKEGIMREIAIYSTKIWRGVTRLENGYRGVTYSVRCVKDVK